MPVQEMAQCLFQFFGARKTVAVCQGMIISARLSKHWLTSFSLDLFEARLGHLPEN